MTPLGTPRPIAGPLESVAITGAAGFVGSHLAELLVARGHRVRGIDNFAPFYARERKEANLRTLDEAPAFDLAAADVLDSGLPSLLKGVLAVVHLAGTPGVRGGDAEEFERQNVEGTRAVVAAAAAVGARRLVIASSSSVYAPASRPTGEHAPLGAPSAYGRSKARGEAAACALAARYGIELVTLRFFTVYGPRQRPDMAFARYVASALSGHPMPLFGDGAQERDFTYVGDAVAGAYAALLRGRPGATYNVSGGRPVALADALALLSGALGRSAPVYPVPSDPREHRRTCADLSRARRDLAYAPRVGLAEGLRRQVAHATSGRLEAPPAAMPEPAAA